MNEPMTLDRAREITSACVRNRVGVAMGNPYSPLPDVSLAEMLEANRLVRQAGPTVNANGTSTMHMVCDPRGIAASYAFEQFGQTPGGVLEAIGYGGLAEALNDERVEDALRAWLEDQS